jgi:hypothetical protein
MLANLFTQNPSYERSSRCIQYWLQGSTPAEIPSELCIESTLGKTIPSRGGLPLRRHLTLKSECRNIELKNFLISSSSYASIQKIGLYISVHSFRDWFLHVSRHLQSPECKINYSTTSAFTPGCCTDSYVLWNIQTYIHSDRLASRPISQHWRDYIKIFYQ